MSNSFACPVCGDHVIDSVTYTKHHRVGRRVFEIPGLKKSVCESCGNEFVLPADQVANAGTIDRVLAQTKAGVTRGQLRHLRETWGVTQRDASRLFGAGDSAFAKWESGQVSMSTPAALLVQCALNVPGVMPYLGTLSGMKLSRYDYRRADAEHASDGGKADVAGADCAWAAGALAIDRSHQQRERDAAVAARPTLVWRSPRVASSPAEPAFTESTYGQHLLAA